MQHEQHRVPVTALGFWRPDVMLAGEGGLLTAYEVPSRKVLARIPVFDGQAIHGIVVGGRDARRVLVYGGSSMRGVRLHFEDDEGGRSHRNHALGDTASAGDWVLDAAGAVVSPGAEEWPVAVVTAHGALVLLTVDASLQLVAEPLVPASNCILYAAQVTWRSPSTCLVASGTAFGDIMVWSAEILGQSGTRSAIWQTHYAFSAHEGSVFGVQFAPSDVLAALGGRRHVLASCSDDRTVRLWDVSDLSLQSPAVANEQRHTGFGAKHTAEAHRPQCLATAMGHLSRVWQVRFVHLGVAAREGENAADAVRVLSFGEDATCITWSLVLKSRSATDPPYDLTQIMSQKAHSGKNIWSVAVGTSSIVATGGADGAVTLRSLLGVGNSHASSRIETSIPPTDSQPDRTRTYSFASESELLAVSDRGGVSLSVLSPSVVPGTREISPALDTLRGYSVSVAGKGAAFFAGISGHVYVYDAKREKCQQIALTEGKVVGLFSQHAPPPESAGHALLVANVGLSYGNCFQVSCHDAAGGMYAARLTRLDYPETNFAVTSFAQCVLKVHRLMVLGSRSGCVAIYSSETGTDGDRLRQSCLADIHGKEAVTSLQFTAPARDECTATFLLSTGRDGTYAVHKLSRSPDGVHLITIHQLSLPFGSNVEGLKCSGDAQLWAWGFRSKQFVVYDVMAQREIMTVDCGGVHRSWTFQPAEEGGTFVWTKASSVFYRRQSSLPFETLNSGGHGREIKAMAFAATTLGVMIASGAEDTAIKLSLHTGGSWRCVHTLQKHNTGIQHLWWTQDGSHLFSSAGTEEFFVWRISHDVPAIGIGVVCESCHPNSGRSDLRIMTFDVQEVPEDGGVDRSFRITMAYSDSSIKTWRYQNRTWTLLAAGQYLTSCLSQCSCIGRHGAVTAGTDGHLARWTMHAGSEASRHTKRWSWSSRHAVHQNAILAMRSEPISASSLLVVTGSDDNALALSLVPTDGGGDVATLVVPRAHAAAVTALAVIKDGPNRFLVATVGVDQRIKLWRLVTDAAGKEGIDGFGIKLLQDSFTAVADASSMEAIPLENGHTGILVCGVGMDLWRLNGPTRYLIPELDALGESLQLEGT